MAAWYEWRTGQIRWTMTPEKPKRGDWPRCGAHCKSTGKPCRARALANGRCKYHGGLSTGPKTPKGRARALANLRQYRTMSQGTLMGHLAAENDDKPQQQATKHK